MRKGIVIATNMMVMIVFLVIAAFVLFMLWGTFASEAGSPSSNMFFKLFDWLASLLSSLA